MTPDEIRELNNRMYAAFKPEGVVLGLGTTGALRFLELPLFCASGLAWSPATDLTEAVKCRPEGMALYVRIFDGKAFAEARLDKGDKCKIQWLGIARNPAAAVCEALLASEEPQ